MATLYDDVDELAKTLGVDPEEATLKIGGDNEDGNADDTGTESESGPAADGDAGAAPEASGSPPEDAPAPQGDSGGAQGDGNAPQSDGEEVLKPDAAAFAKQRRELREMKAKLAALEKAPAPEAKAEPKPEVKAAPQEPNKEENYQQWLEWKLVQNDNTAQEQRQLIEKLSKVIDDNQRAEANKTLIRNAVDEFTGMEEAYKKENPDYENATQFARGKYEQSIKILYPNMTQKQVDAAIDQQILNFAADCAKKGLNPAEEFYDMAIERFGYAKAKAEEPKEPKEPKAAKPDLKIISANKKRSASPLMGGSQGGALALTKEIVADMSMAEFSRLTPDQLAALEGA